MSVLLVYIIPSIGLIGSRQVEWAKLLVILLLTGVSVELIKPLFNSPRPEGAKGCGPFCIEGPVNGKPGFPSGHAAGSTVFALGVLHMFPSMELAALLLLWTGLIGWSRIEKKCHTLIQIAGGYAYGCVVSLVFLIG